MSKDLYLVRHGQTIFNLKRIIQGWSDSPLTQLGCDQAARAGMFLRARGIEPDHAYTSTLHRTEQTIANLWSGLAYERLDGLREWFFGDFEAERVMLMPERPWRDFYCQFGGEGQMQVRERMVATLTDLMRRPDHECVLAVSHGSAIKEFLDHVRTLLPPSAPCSIRRPTRCSPATPPMPPHWLGHRKFWQTRPAPPAPTLAKNRSTLPSPRYSPPLWSAAPRRRSRWACSPTKLHGGSSQA